MTSTGETQDGNSIEVDEGASVTYSVSKTGYVTQSSTISDINEDKTVSVTLQEEVAETDLTGVSHLYRKNSNFGLYSDVTFETAFNATFNNQSYQIIADPSYYITTETVDYTLLKANDKNVVDEDGYQLVLYDGEIYKIVDGTPETTSVDVTDEELRATYDTSVSGFDGYTPTRDEYSPSNTKSLYKNYDESIQTYTNELSAQYGQNEDYMYFDLTNTITVGGDTYYPIICSVDSETHNVYDENGNQMILHGNGGSAEAGYTWSYYTLIDNVATMQSGSIIEPGRGST